MKKAQIQSQVIVYILAVIIMGLILVFGYNGLKKMQETACEVNKIEFLTDIKSDIDVIGSGYGDSKMKTYRLTCGDYRQVCFVNLDHIDTEPTSPFYNQNDVVYYLEDLNDMWVSSQGVYGMEVKAIIRDAVSDMIPDPLDPDKILADRKNMFLCPPCTEQDYVGNITIWDEDDKDTIFRCFDLKQGKMYITITGRGNLATLSNGVDYKN